MTREGAVLPSRHRHPLHFVSAADMQAVTVGDAIYGSDVAHHYFLKLAAAEGRLVNPACQERGHLNDAFGRFGSPLTA